MGDFTIKASYIGQMTFTTPCKILLIHWEFTAIVDTIGSQNTSRARLDGGNIFWTNFPTSLVKGLYIYTRIMQVAHSQLWNKSQQFGVWPLEVNNRTKNRSRNIYQIFNELTIIGSDNGLMRGRHQAIIWTNEGILNKLLGILNRNSRKRISEMSFAKWRQIGFGLNVLRLRCTIWWHTIRHRYCWPFLLQFVRSLPSQNSSLQTFLNCVCTYRTIFPPAI